jgi:hypothetical protein
MSFAQGPMGGQGPMMGGGDFFNQMGPRGRFGPWPACGCSSFLIIIAGIILVCAGFLRLFQQ